MSVVVQFLFFAVSFAASIAGAICGIGGGVIIKPALDAFGVLSVSVISFLSGCTVLAMTCYSVMRGKINGESLIDMKTGTPLAVGAAAGGVAGKFLFQAAAGLFADKNMVGAVQAAFLFLITLGTLVYTLKKDRIRTCHVVSWAPCLALGVVLGIFSSFLGIGGGPINLVVLFYFFSMETKTAAQNSLYIILFSQIASLISSIVTGTVPQFPPGLLVLMAGGGILGGVCGRVINKKIVSKTVDRLFIVLMCLIILTNVYNFFKYI